jgi:hypothetical protein
LTPLELRHLEAAADFCADEDCRTCALLAKLLHVVNGLSDQVEELTDLLAARDEQIAQQDELLDEAFDRHNHSYLPWSSAYEPLRG